MPRGSVEIERPQDMHVVIAPNYFFKAAASPPLNSSVECLLSPEADLLEQWQDYSANRIDS
jgi:hypothetical protein